VIASQGGDDVYPFQCVEAPPTRHLSITNEFMIASGQTVDASPDPTLLELYKIAWETRNLEISLYWQRSNYFLILNSALAVGFFTRPQASGMPEYAVGLAIFGIVCSFLWIRINAGSKFWQSRWEHRLAELEKRLGVEPPPAMFAATFESIEEDAKAGLQFGEHSFPRNVWDHLVLAKPSVTSTMALLSAVFTIAWCAALLFVCVSRLSRS